jgi:hypothetical protein
MPNERNQLTRQAASPDTITDPAADWVASNWILQAGQWGFETDTGKVKLGDGVTPWNDLGYFGGSGGGGGPELLWQVRYQDPNNATPTYAQAVSKTDVLKQVFSVAPLGSAFGFSDAGMSAWFADGVVSDLANTGGFKFYPETSGWITVDYFAFLNFSGGDQSLPSSIGVDFANAAYGPNYLGYKWCFDRMWGSAPNWSTTRFIDLPEWGGVGEQLGVLVNHGTVGTQYWGMQSFECNVSWTPAPDRPGPLAPYEQ